MSSILARNRTARTPPAISNGALRSSSYRMVAASTCHFERSASSLAPIGWLPPPPAISNGALRVQLRQGGCRIVRNPQRTHTVISNGALRVQLLQGGCRVVRNPQRTMEPAFFCTYQSQMIRASFFSLLFFTSFSFAIASLIYLKCSK